ncbi:unnamed protein product, partial [Sphacelaria rigidula]
MIFAATFGGTKYSFVACLGRLTINHASLSRRSTFPTRSKKHLQHSGAHCASSIHYTRTFYRSYPRPVSPYVATIPPGIPIVFSLLSNASNAFMPPSFTFRIPPCRTS